MGYSSWAEIEPTATPAERQLKACAEAGEPCVLGPYGSPPPAPEDWKALDPTRHIRANVLQFIVLSQITTKKGIQLTGADIVEPIDFESAKIPFSCTFKNCRSLAEITFANAHLTGTLAFENCCLRALNASNMEITSQLILRDTHFIKEIGIGLMLQGARIGEGAYLAGIKMHSCAKLSGMNIGGALELQNASFSKSKGTDADSYALSLENTQIMAQLAWQNVSCSEGIISFTGSSIATLDDRDRAQGNGPDDIATWAGNAELILNGFTYDQITGATDAKTRLAWLAKGDHLDGEFFPHPYKQLAKVLYDMGHEADAREVLFTLEQKLSIERQNTLRQDIKTLRQTAPETGLDIAQMLLLGIERGKDWLLRSIIGYGYKPFRSLAALILLVFLFWLFTLAAWHTGGFAPNSGVILTSPDWTALGTQHPNAAAAWATLAPAGQDWESFGSFAYALDVVIPIIEFGQTDAWAPSTSRGLAGSILWWARWPFIIAGWIVTALGAAALTGVIQRK
ncbi:hypothetical protein [Epibacterium ulvae]|uniref:hypothetical protein n=1 Tax=Epibacterium ulvae TaxID=1156985 RepID=UPI0024901DC6|nr:hypothetical protein [Epibacterium ulvae]